MIRINQSEEESKLSDPNEQYEFNYAAKEEENSIETIKHPCV